MQTVSASSLRSSAGISNCIGRIASQRSQSRSPSSSFSALGFTTRQHYLHISNSYAHLEAYRRSLVLPRARSIRFYSTSNDSPPSISATAASASTSTTRGPATQESLSTLSSAAHLPSSTMVGANTSPRVKRKPEPFEMNESGRPAKKLLRSSMNGGRQSPGDNTPDVVPEDLEMADDYDDEPALQALAALGPETAEWQTCVENVVRNVVSIRFCQTCSFDTDPALNSEATGFVVDAERGYILTNRHGRLKTLHDAIYAR